MDSMKLVIVGHVDHGKSTIVGHLLSDLKLLPENKEQRIRDYCERNAKPFEYAYILDAFQEEQGQGITIDMARCFFTTERRRYIFIDTPGHGDFMKSMVTGASSAEIAFIVIDAKDGVRENTLKHGHLLSMLGIKNVILLINKMDLVHYSEKVYDEVTKEYNEFLLGLNITPICAIPVSGTEGDNLAKKSSAMVWYKGPTMIEALDSLETNDLVQNDVFRMPIQGIYKFTEYGDCRRILVGTVLSGKVAAGDKVVFYPSGKKAQIATLEFHGKTKECYEAGEASSVTLKEDIYIKRGEVMCKAGDVPPLISSCFRANIYWCGAAPLELDKKYLLKCETYQGIMQLRSIEKKIHTSNGEYTENNNIVSENEIATIEFVLDSPMACERISNGQYLSRFVIVDQYDISGGGIVTDIGNSDSNWDYSEQGGIVTLLTGLSGAGKTTLGRAVVKRLRDCGKNAILLDGDLVRHTLNSDLGFSAEDRIENIRRIAHVANMMKSAGMTVVVAMIAPYREGRDMMRNIVGDCYYEVFVDAKLETCIMRDVKGLYEKAKRQQVKSFTGLSDKYEIPDHSDLILNTDDMSCEKSTALLYDFIMSKLNRGRL